MRFAFVILAFAATVLPDQAASQSATYLAPTVGHILKQPGCPATVVNYTVKRRTKKSLLIPSQDGDVSGNGEDHKANVRNVGDQVIVAMRLVFVSFDIWDEHLTTWHHDFIWNITQGGKRDTRYGCWYVSVFPLHTGIVFIDRLRFQDDTIWRTDRERMLAQMSELGFPVTDDQIEAPEIRYDEMVPTVVTGKVKSKD